ncbi:YGGT family protein [Candidatus Bealeia paramacronuclearis]|uniref:YGGT family protein n=1 Tax=Candidatus Bealeia paramacronuclearis TaxID=1921001 RepID=A0ABZ2C3Z7_9PROT|nr:YGGT family protein [Candidatus Bealeia paramacronuclearis]
MDIILIPLLTILDKIIELYVLLIFVSVIMSWLMAFNVINRSNQFVLMVSEFLYRVTEPALRPLRKIIPNLGGIDLSPVALIFILYFLQMVIGMVIMRLIVAVPAQLIH